MPKVFYMIKIAKYMANKSERRNCIKMSNLFKIDSELLEESIATMDTVYDASSAQAEKEIRSKLLSALSETN